MKRCYIGIDLGTTNSVVCSYDGENKPEIWKSPEGHETTPSAIYHGPKGQKLIGYRALEMVRSQPERVARVFKRFLGTATPIELPEAKLTLTPELCSTDILKTLMGYLPEEIRNREDLSTVVTVPAAFNQMQKDATQSAAGAAQIDRISLISEPVAAVMGVTSYHVGDGKYLIYDLGGGTLDVSIAQSKNKRIDVLMAGGISMCGGRDFDRMLVEKIVNPWLTENFNLPDQFGDIDRYRKLRFLSPWAAEQAKISLSSKDSAVIEMSEDEIRIRDENGAELYFDIPLTRQQLNRLIEEQIAETVASAKDVVKRAKLSIDDLTSIVFVGGPTLYEPLRDMVSEGLGIGDNVCVDPMTIVAQGAGLIAESINWEDQEHNFKKGSRRITTGKELGISFHYLTRTTNRSIKIAALCPNPQANQGEWQLDSVDTGWTSGRIVLADKSEIEVPLTNMGENKFKISAFDAMGQAIVLEEDELVVTLAAAIVDSIASSHSIGIETMKKNLDPSLVMLIRSGEPLPKKGVKTFRSAETLEADSDNAINFKLWEGDHKFIDGNRFIGLLTVSGKDFDEGAIKKGDELICRYEVSASGNIQMDVEIPKIGKTFQSGKNFYSRQAGQLNYATDAGIVARERAGLEYSLERLPQTASDSSLSQARHHLKIANELQLNSSDPENTQGAWESLQKARSYFAEFKQKHPRVVPQFELDHEKEVFLRENITRVNEIGLKFYENLSTSIQKMIDQNDKRYRAQLQKLKHLNISLLWSQDWFKIRQFELLTTNPLIRLDESKVETLKGIGESCIENKQFDKLFEVIKELQEVTLCGNDNISMNEQSNLFR